VTDEDLAGVRVTDTGVGIERHEHEAIFEPFVQVGRTLTKHHEGTGLGLSISRALARAMGGDLTVCSTPGAGSAFTLMLKVG
jgi:signal transduction histidine kinase